MARFNSRHRGPSAASSSSSSSSSQVFDTFDNDLLPPLRKMCVACICLCVLSQIMPIHCIKMKIFPKYHKPRWLIRGRSHCYKTTWKMASNPCTAGCLYHRLIYIDMSMLLFFLLLPFHCVISLHANLFGCVAATAVVVVVDFTSSSYTNGLGVGVLRLRNLPKFMNIYGNICVDVVCLNLYVSVILWIWNTLWLL